MIRYECIDKEESWTCEIHMLRNSEPYEMNLDTNGNRYHIIVGSHSYGNYICIPNWSIGSELASFYDIFWNTEQLMKVLSEKDATGIAQGLKIVHEMYAEKF